MPLLFWMAKNKLTMPSSGAGITRYFDDYKSKIEISPGQVIILAIILMIIVILLNQFGSKIIGAG